MAFTKLLRILGSPMNSKTCLAFVLTAFALACGVSLSGQTVSSSLVGTVVDPADAVVVNVPVTLTNPDTGATRTATTDSSGTYRFLELVPGTYTVTVKAPGFKTSSQTNIVVAAEETRSAGKIALEIGSLSDSVSVTAEATEVQLASSEKSQTVDGNQLDDITLKGRDLFGYLRLVPGVIDTSTSRDVTGPNQIQGITINGNTSAKNFTVDGITDMDTGSNTTLHYEPNIDAIQELKVLSSNYQAEFGRNSGGTITVVTKNGTQQFHGTGMWNHRHEEFNANTWANNHNVVNGAATPRVPYRYNVETYSIGGPIYIPKHFNTRKTRLFFFESQEYTGQFVSGGTQSKYTPTALERTGDFSQSFNNNGTLVKITDPSNNNVQFPGNMIPASRLTPVGQAMLDFFPLPNFTPTLPAQLNVVNYFEQGSATHPRRNDVVRIDGTITSKLSGYFRYINDHDDMLELYEGVSFTSDVGGTLGAKGIAPIDHPNPGHSYSGSATYTISPSLINEVTVGESWNTWSYYSTDDYKSEDRGLVPGVPSLFPVPTGTVPGYSAVNSYQNLLPTFSFGSPPSNSMAYSRVSNTAGAFENFNPIWTYLDNLSKVVGKHTLKTGIYVEHNTKLEPFGENYMGAFNFGPSSSNLVNNTGDGYANAILGNVASYSQTSAVTEYDVVYWNVEFYVQDNWKVNRRLTLDLGVRFYHQTPQVDLHKTFDNFIPADYSKAAIPRIYVAGCTNGATTCSGATRQAEDPLTKTFAPVAYIGLFVPNTGNPSSGMVQLGANGVPLNPYSFAPIAAAPRVGFAYDVFGDGKMAIRGGYGMFYNRLDGNQVYNLSGQPPTVFTPTISYTTFAQMSATGNNLVYGPCTCNSWSGTGNYPWEPVQNASLDIQRTIGKDSVVDIGYTGNFSSKQNLTYDINAVPLGARAPFTPSAADPTNGSGSYASDIFLRTTYPGYGAINSHAFLGHSNYNALTGSWQRRETHGIAWGVAYTYSKAMGVTTYTPPTVVPNNEEYNYGRLSTDRVQNLQINYNYNIPGIGKKMNSKPMGIFTDLWSLSGITSYQSGGPYSPTFSFTSGTVPDYTGTPDATARINVVGNPLVNVPAGAYFNPNAFALPALGTSSPSTPLLGNRGGGSGVLSLPGKTNFDMTLSKSIPLGSEKRVLKLQVQAYNVFNHTEYSALNTAIQFNPTTGAVGNLSSVGIPSAALTNRVLAFSTRIQF